MFVHLAPESSVARIRRSGNSRLRKASNTFPGGVFAVPVTRNFFLSHQWLRELKRRGAGPIAGVYFRVPDDEQVWVGHYHQAHRWMRAAEAVAEFMSAEAKAGRSSCPARLPPRRSTGCGHCARSLAGDTIRVLTARRRVRVRIAHAGSTRHRASDAGSAATDRCSDFPCHDL